MKILHIIDSGGLYGAEIMLLNLVAEQLKMGLKPAIASIGEKGIATKPLETEAVKRGYNVKQFRMTPGPNVAGAMEILRLAQREEFDVIHSHGYKGNVLFGLIPKKIRKLPMVATLHGYTSTNGFSKNKFYEICDSFSLRFIDAVILVSKAMLSNSRLKNISGINFHVIPNGIPITETQFDKSTNQPFNDSLSIVNYSTNQQFNQNATPPPHLPTFSHSQHLDKTIVQFCQKGFTIGSIGRLSPEKGYIYLIEAFRQVRAKFGDMRLAIIGEGGDRKLLERKIAECNLEEYVLLPGYKRDAKKYLNLFQVFVLSSLTEGLPITLLEAMQAGVPIVATQVGGVPEVLGCRRSGMLVEPADSSQLAEAILSIRRSRRKAKDLVKTALKDVRNKYSSKLMAKKYAAVYKEVLETSKNVQSVPLH